MERPLKLCPPDILIEADNVPIITGAIWQVGAGCGGHGDRMVANIAACGIGADQVDYLLLTHCHFDHMGGAASFRHHYDCGGHYGFIQGTGEVRAFIRSFL